MRLRPIAIALSLTLVSSGSALAQGYTDTTAPTGSGVAMAALPTTSILQRAADTGTLKQVLTTALGNNPTPERVTAVKDLLKALAKTRPSTSAKAAEALAELAGDLASTNPDGALLMANAAVEVLSEPAVIDADPKGVGQALVALAATVSVASKSPKASGTGGPKPDSILAAIEALATNATLLAAMPDLGDQIVLAEVNPGNFVTAAGGAGAPGDFVTGAGGGEDAFAALDATESIADEIEAQDQAIYSAETPTGPPLPASPTSL